MGKIQKIKQERKRAEAEEQLKKAKNKRLYIKLFFVLIFIFTLTGFRSFYYQKYGSQIKDFLMGVFKSQNKQQKFERRTYSKVPEMQIDTQKKYTAKFETTKGNFEVELYTNKAPKTVNNFVFLARESFYDGLTFHRVIKDFMIQGGDPKGDGSGGPGYAFEDEINDIKLKRGVLAMANSGPNTNGSQFFIVTKEATDWLDGKHTAFGRVTNGLDVVMNIEKIETDENDRPKDPIIIKRIIIEER